MSVSPSHRAAFDVGRLDCAQSPVVPEPHFHITEVSLAFPSLDAILEEVEKCRFSSAIARILQLPEKIRIEKLSLLAPMMVRILDEAAFVKHSEEIPLGLERDTFFQHAVEELSSMRRFDEADRMAQRISDLNLRTAVVFKLVHVLEAS